MAFAVEVAARDTPAEAAELIVQCDPVVVPVSPRQVDLREVLGAATPLGVVPQTLVVIRIEPETTEGLHIGLSDSVSDSVDRAVGEASRVPGEWGMA